jgi:16S rRNA (uracil1498-N3)-methyltransferase
MQRYRFFATPAQFTSSTVTLDADEAHHLTRVLRLSEGAQVFVFDGVGNEWRSEVARIHKREVELTLRERLSDAVESPLALTLAQALVKGDKFDWIVQKATELGVSRIVPLITEHSDIRRAEERAEQKLQRWQRIALEALKQCGRRKLVDITTPVPFSEFSAPPSAETTLFFSERGGRSLHEVAASLRPELPLNLCIASEGGWSEAEIQKAEADGFLAIHLGSRILRTETAAITAVALAQHHFGDLR